MLRMPTEGIHYDSSTGSLEYDVWSAQQDALEAWLSGDSQIVEFRAGFRAGKSVLGARGTIYGAWVQANTRWLVMAESFQEGWQTTYRTLFEQLPGYDGDDPESSPIVEEFKRQEKVLKLKNGSVIVLGSASKADRHKGDEFAGIWCDEVAFYKNLYSLTEMLLSRLSADADPLSMIWTTTTNGYNDYYYIVEERVDADGDPLPWDIHTVTANSLENPFISHDVKDNLKRTHANNKAEGLYGGFSASDGRVYEEFTRETHVVADSDVTLTNWRMYAYDSGWNDPRVLIEIGQTTEGQLVILDEFYESECTVEDAIEWLRGRVSGTIYSEHEPEHIAKFREELDGFIVKRADKSIDRGIEKVQERLKEDSQGLRGLLVHEQCNETIKEFLSYTADDVGGTNVDDHTMDCVRYAVATSTGSVPRAGEDGSGKRVSVRSSNNPSSRVHAREARVRSRRERSRGSKRLSDYGFREI